MRIMPMPDEPDTQLLRRFAEAHQPLSGTQFVAQVAARLSAAPVPGPRMSALWSVPRTIAGGLVTGISAPLRLKYAALMAGVAAAVTLWTTLA
jgi:hypothetical protein